MRHFVGFTFLMVASVGFVEPLFAQALPAGVTPAMAQQAKSLSPAQQKALAKQYGVDLPSSGGGTSTGDSSGIGDAGEALDQAESSLEEEDMSRYTSRAGGAVGRRYGQNLFNRKVSTFAPTDDAPVP